MGTFATALPLAKKIQAAYFPPMAEEASKWSETKLWEELKRRKEADSNTQGTASRIVSLLENEMPGIEIILSNAQTGPLVFTLHNDKHSFHVAERIMALVKPNLTSAMIRSATWKECLSL